MGEPKIGQCMELPEISPVPDWCHTSPSITNSELCEPEKKNSPLLKTLVPRPISCGSGSGTLTSANAARQAAATSAPATLPTLLELMPLLPGNCCPTFHQNTCKSQILFPDTKHPTEILPSRAMKNIADRQAMTSRGFSKPSRVG